MDAKIPKKKVRSNQSQQRLLVEYMTLHRNLANNEFSGPMGNENMLKEWATLRAMLKEHGPDKTVGQWRNTWRDLKKKARYEGARIRAARTQTGNLVHVPSISEMSSKILSVIGRECSFGIGEPRESGIGSFMAQPSPQATAAIVPQQSEAYLAGEESFGGETVNTTSAPHHSPPLFYDSWVTEEDIHIETLMEEPSVSNLPPTLATPQHRQTGLAHAPAVGIPPPSPITPQQRRTRLAHAPGVATLPPCPVTPQQRRVGLGGAVEFLAAEHDTTNVLKDILNVLNRKNQILQIKQILKQRNILRQRRRKY